MKKRGIKKIDGNVFLFPDLEKRLIEKGLEFLQNKKFHEAIEAFERANEIDPENNDVYIGLVLAYYESGLLQQARNLSAEMLKKGIGEYFQTVDLYLMILVQLHEYEEIVHTIEVLFDEREIPADLLEHFSKMLVFSRRMIQEKPNHLDNLESTVEKGNHLSIDFLKNPDPNKLLLDIAELSHHNVRTFIDEVKIFLKEKDGHPFLKTMVLNILKEQEYEKEILIEKFGRKKTIIPVSLHNVHESKQKEEIQKELQNQLENEDPILYQQVISLLERQLFLLYPFDLLPDQSTLWGAAFHFIGLEYHGIEKTQMELAEQYSVDTAKLETACAFIRKLEEISYPII